MTLHTRVAVTSGDVTKEEVFAFCRGLIGATDEYEVYPDNPTSMRIGQGLPALMWVEDGSGEPEPHDRYCEPNCSGEYHDPAHTVMAHFDTAYGYRGEYRWGREATCGDLHAHLVASLARWLTAQGCEWRWYDESGDGWGVDALDLGSLGSPRLGAVGLPDEDGQR